MSRLLRTLIVVLLAARGAAAEERWYTYAIGGTPVGHLSEAASAEDGALRTDAVLFARLNRLGKSFEMRFATVARETPAGDLQSLSFESLRARTCSRMSSSPSGAPCRASAATARSGPSCCGWRTTVCSPSLRRRPRLIGRSGVGSRRLSSAPGAP